MSRRVYLLGVLFAAPFMLLIAYDCYALWRSGWGFWAWWPLPLCLAAGYFLARLHAWLAGLAGDLPHDAGNLK